MDYSRGAAGKSKREKISNEIIKQVMEINLTLRTKYDEAINVVGTCTRNAQSQNLKKVFEMKSNGKENMRKASKKSTRNLEEDL